MCRLAAYIGPAIPLAQVVIDPTHSLLEQSQCANEAKVSVQGDGFGFAWYDGDKGPGLYRDVLPAWTDGNLPSLCHMIRSDLFMAHVRASTAGETSRVNCHPFTHKGWSFMHNGQVPDISLIRRSLEATLPDDLYDARRGTTDSELIFLLLLANGLLSDPPTAVRTTLTVLRQHSTYGTGLDAVRLTCVFSDGHNLYAFRHASDARAPTLYAACKADQSWILASEPLENSSHDWTEIPTETFVTLSRGASNLTVAPLEIDVAA
jgi:glutamine amidotransferase